MALVIFSAVVLAWSRATDGAVAGAVAANQERALRMLAARKLAEIRAKPSEFEEGAEGGFEEEVDLGEDNPYVDYRWQVEVEEVRATPRGGEDGEDVGFLFSADDADEAPAPADGKAAPKERRLLRLDLTVSYVPAGEEGGDRFHVVTYLPAPEEEGQGAPR
ncbi:MAG: hypothetical protein HUU06_08060 [Planctomycetaceae bacterium]|nr:hypothetical protein [Planctomycetaceae bacterium]